MVNWEDSEVLTFKEEANKIQQEYGVLLGDRIWDVIEKKEETILFAKIGFGLFGPPSSEPTDENLNTGYSEDKVIKIREIASVLLKDINFKTQDLHFACIFITGKIREKRFTVPVFKSKEVNADSGIFVDSNGRVYKDWSDYLKNNKLPKCIYCYPRQGFYEFIDKTVDISYDTSPACKFLNSVLRVSDIASTVVTIGATVVGVAALFTPVGGVVLTGLTIAGASTGVYGVSRSSIELVDRATHGQSITLKDAEARSQWLSLVGSSLGFAQGQMFAAVGRTARAGEVMGKAGRIAFAVVQAGNLTVGGLGIIHGISVLIDKSERNELTPLDVFQFSTSILFFTNSVVNFKTASAITKEIQQDIIKGHQNELTGRAKKLFKRHAGQLRGKDELHGNAKVVKQLNRIENTKDLYKLMVDQNVSNCRVKLTDKGYKGVLNVNKSFKIEPLALLEMPHEARQQIFTSTKNFSTGTITLAQFQSHMEGICSNHRISFENMKLDTANKLCYIYSAEKISDIVVNKKNIFGSANLSEFAQLRVILDTAVKSADIILPLLDEFAEYAGCTTMKEYLKYADAILIIIKAMVLAYDEEYQKALTTASELLKINFNKVKFDKDYGFEGPKNEHFTKLAITQIRKEGFENLKKQFSEVNNNHRLLSHKLEPNALNDDQTSYHFIRHDYLKKSTLTHQEYFEIVEDWFGNTTNYDNALVSQEENCTIITYFSPLKGVKSIKIDRSEDYAIVTVLYDKPENEEEESVLYKKMIRN